MAIIGMLLFVGLLFLVQRGLYSRYWDKGLTMKISFSAPEATEGDDLVLTQELSNAKGLPLPWVNSKFQTSRELVFHHSTATQVSDHYNQNNIFSVGRYQRITRHQEFRCQRRGFYQIQSMDISSTDLFFRKQMVRHYPCDAKLTVLPRQIPFADLQVAFQQIYGDIEVQRFTNPDPFAFRGLREYTWQDDFRHINFKASAQTGELMVNVFSATASQELVVLLNLEPYSQWTSEAVLEDSIRLAASISDYFSGLGVSVALLSNGKDIVTKTPVQINAGTGEGHTYNILRRLAWIDLSQDCEPLSVTMNTLQRTEPVYVLISPHHGEDLVDSLSNMLERGLPVRWILPSLKDSDIRIPDTLPVTRWEVTPYDKPSAYRKTSHR